MAETDDNKPPCTDQFEELLSRDSKNRIHIHSDVFEVNVETHDQEKAQQYAEQASIYFYKHFKSYILFNVKYLNQILKIEGNEEEYTVEGEWKSDWYAKSVIDKVNIIPEIMEKFLVDKQRNMSTFVFLNLLFEKFNYRVLFMVIKITSRLQGNNVTSKSILYTTLRDIDEAKTDDAIKFFEYFPYDPLLPPFYYILANPRLFYLWCRSKNLFYYFKISNLKLTAAPNNNEPLKKSVGIVKFLTDALNVKSEISIWSGPIVKVPELTSMREYFFDRTTRVMEGILLMKYEHEIMCALEKYDLLILPNTTTQSDSNIERPIDLDVGPKTGFVFMNVMRYVDMFKIIFFTSCYPECDDQTIIEYYAKWIYIRDKTQFLTGWMFTATLLNNLPTYRNELWDNELDSTSVSYNDKMIIANLRHHKSVGLYVQKMVDIFMPGDDRDGVSVCDFVRRSYDQSLPSLITNEAHHTGIVYRLPEESIERIKLAFYN